MELQEIFHNIPERAFLIAIPAAIVCLKVASELYKNWKIKRRIRKLAAEKNIDASKIISYRDLPQDTFNEFIGGWRLLSQVAGNTHRINEFHWDRTQKYGKYSVATIPFRRGPIIFIQDPDMIEYILKTNFYNYEKGEVSRRIFQDFLGEGIFNSDGNNWKQQRATASHLFSIRELKSMVEVFTKHGKVVLDILMKSSKDSKIDVQELFQRFTLDSFGEIALGVEIGSLHTAEIPFAVAFDKINTLTVLRFSSPLWKLKRKLQLPGTNERNLSDAIKLADQFVMGIIQTRKSENFSDREDLISLYLRLIKPTLEDGNDRHLRDFVLNFILAGRDTTGALLTFAFYELSKNPLVLQKLIAEIDSTLQGNIPDYDAIKNMKYLKAVLDETLRLHPPVPFNAKESLEDDILPNNIYIPKYARLGYNLWVIGRMEEYWENPLEFRPERFLDGKQMKHNVFMPFHWGNRLCLGQNMAYIEAKILVCMILQKMKFTDAPKDILCEPSATAKVAGGMNLRVVLRD